MRKGPRVDSQPVVHALAVEARRGPACTATRESGTGILRDGPLGEMGAGRPV